MRSARSCNQVVNAVSVDEDGTSATVANRIRPGHRTTCWYIDSTPADDDEFDRIEGDSELRAWGGAAANRIDLLTTVMHELGHVLGLDDDHEEDDDLMFESLGLGTRRLVDDELISLLANS